MFTTKAIGFITSHFQSLYHTPLIHMLHARARERGYRLLGVMGAPDEIAAARVAFDHVDGWLAINTTLGIENLHNAGKPLILISGPHATVPCVMSDNHGGTAAALTHLIAQGRTRIAFVTYAINRDFRERYAAYSAILADHGIALDPALVLDTQSYQVYDAYQAVRGMITDGSHFDAVFCANDWLAFGTMQAVQEAGWRIPEDVAVIGFDDTVQAQFVMPPLTSVRQSPAELGRVAIELLLDQIERGMAPPQITTVPTSLIIRQSSMPVQQIVPESSAADRYRGADWQNQLARDLAQQTIFPAQLAPNTAAEQILPGVDELVAALAAAVDGRGPQDIPPGIWERFLSFEHGGTMTPLIELLRRAGVQRIDGADYD
ncbi:MAG TPA: substrate-binding domain-containing protein, partial [Roseiflexaceae bacterium]|nr:substrate-binding domain-containing protein [Roseiflexaceae bacterium]